MYIYLKCKVYPMNMFHTKIYNKYIKLLKNIKMIIEDMEIVKYIHDNVD